MSARKWRVLTLARLKKEHACAAQRIKFRRRFGAAVRVTEGRMLAVAQTFSWWWASARLLSAPAQKRHALEMRPANRAANRAHKKAWRTFDDINAAQQYAHSVETIAARDARYAAHHAANAGHNRAAAVAFARAYINDRVRK